MSINCAMFIKDKIAMIILIDAGKTFDSTPFHDKLSQQLGMKGNFLNMIKGIYQKPTSKIILDGSRLNVECSPPKIRKNTRMFSLTAPI